MVAYDAGAQNCEAYCRGEGHNPRAAGIPPAIPALGASEQDLVQQDQRDVYCIPSVRAAEEGQDCRDSDSAMLPRLLVSRTGRQAACCYHHPGVRPKSPSAVGSAGQAAGGPSSAGCLRQFRPIAAASQEKAVRVADCLNRPRLAEPSFLRLDPSGRRRPAARHALSPRAPRRQARATAPPGGAGRRQHAASVRARGRRPARGPGHPAGVPPEHRPQACRAQGAGCPGTTAALARRARP
mmetsp:Transcript_50860/g.115694  ORF Transcript_50860/g.115694 Transcript_50860/m.115694 type:complete len:239 (+) Transcript_50860:4048-4764(+)